MSFFKNLFKPKEEPIKSNTDFWEWFKQHESTFYTIIKNGDNVDELLFNQLASKLNQIKLGYFYLAGMAEENIAELVITVDGDIKNIAFVEELIAEAPKLPNWKFTALKEALNIEDVNIEMNEISFNASNIFFQYKEDKVRPDEIDIIVTHNNMNESNRNAIITGIYIFLDNYLGELNFITTIDNLDFIAKNESNEEWVPINKLKDFLLWREKEFIEKYDGKWHSVDSNNYSILEAQTESGNGLIAVINTDLLDWDSKASHPWMIVVSIEYDGKKHRGMPDEKTMELLNNIEEEIEKNLTIKEGYINFGRQTANSVREIYFPCKDFRKPSKVLYQLQQRYANKLPIKFEIYKDKYWRTFDRFKQHE